MAFTEQHACLPVPSRSDMFLNVRTRLKSLSCTILHAFEKKRVSRWRCEACGDETTRKLRRLESPDYRYGYCTQCRGERTWGKVFTHVDTSA